MSYVSGPSAFISARLPAPVAWPPGPQRARGLARAPASATWQAGAFDGGVRGGTTLTALSLAAGAWLRARWRPRRRGRGLDTGPRRGRVLRAVGADAEEADAAEGAIQVGMAVKVVADDVELRHVPRSKGVPYNAAGLQGVVVSVQQDKHLTANRPVLVKILKAASGADLKFNAHFSADELQQVSDEDVAGRSSDAVVPAAVAPARHSGSPVARSAVAMSSTWGIEAPTDDRWLINLLFDGMCPSCMKQVEFLQKRMDENPEYAGLVRMTNLHAAGYNATEHGGVEFEDGMRHLHAVTRDGEVVTGMDVFRRVYSIVGMEWVYQITTLPVVGEAFDWLYDLWAEHRLFLSGRHDVLQRIQEHKHNIEELATVECEDECEIDWDNPSGPVPRPVPVKIH